MKNFKALQELVTATEKDASAFFEKGNKAAGTRLRNAMQQLKGLAQAVRNEVIEKKKTA